MVVVVVVVVMVVVVVVVVVAAAVVVVVVRAHCFLGLNLRGGLRQLFMQQGFHVSGLQNLEELLRTIGQVRIYVSREIPRFCTS